MNLGRHHDHPRGRTYVVGARPVQQRQWSGLLAKLGLGVAVGGLAIWLAVDSGGAQEMEAVGVVDRHSLRLVGKVMLPASVVTITDGPHRGQEVTVTGREFSPGTPVVVEVGVGKLSEDLYGRAVRAKPKTP